MAVSTMSGIPALKELSTDLKRRMDQAVATFQANLASTRTGRASVHMLDQVKVDYYGTPTALRQLAGFSVPDAMLLVVSPYDKGSLNAIEKAIASSDLGINPSNDGNVIRLAFPPLTEERRKELVKKLAEDARLKKLV